MRQCPKRETFLVQCNTVQYSTVQYSAVQYNTVQYSTAQYSTVQYSTVQHSTAQYSTVVLTSGRTPFQGRSFTDGHLRVPEHEGFEEVLRELSLAVLASLQTKDGQKGARNGSVQSL